MKNPLHPGELIRDNLVDLGLSVAEVPLAWVSPGSNFTTS
jgi:hypothetical protein